MNEAVTSPGGAVERDVVVAGLRLHTERRHGTVSPPLVLIHGIGGSLESWTPLLDALPDRDVVMIDCPGVGRSQRPRLPIRIPATADYIVGALRELGIERADVLGYSMGGIVAQEIARRQPDLVRKLVLVATISGIWVRPPKFRAQLALASTKRYRDRAAAAREIPILAGGRTARDPEALTAILDGRTGHPPSTAGYRYQQLAIIGWTSFLWLPRLKAETLVIAGEDDPVVRPANARVLAERIRQATFEVIPGAGHMLLFDETHTAAALIDRFLG